jgi:nicotinate-nucleotide adenylyltransferase
MNIGILGGSFDPPHKGHITIAKRLLRLNHFDQIWLMPCYQHPFVKNLSASNKRFEMTKFLENKKIKVSDLEISKKTTNYSINTLKALAKKYPKDKFSWIIGTDQVEDFPRWKEWKTIINNFKLIIVPRINFKKAEKKIKDIVQQAADPKNILLIDKKKFPPTYASSTLVRQKVREKKSILSLVPKEVEKYIIQHGLYL